MTTSDPMPRPDDDKRMALVRDYVDELIRVEEADQSARSDTVNHDFWVQSLVTGSSGSAPDTLHQRLRARLLETDEWRYLASTHAQQAKNNQYSPQRRVDVSTVRGELIDRRTSLRSVTQPSVKVSPTSGVVRTGRRDRRVLIPLPKRTWAQFATACLLVVVMVAFVFFASSLPQRKSPGSDHEPTVIPTYVPTPGITVEQIGSATLPIDTSTNVQEIWRVEMVSATFAAGESGSQPRNNPASGTGLEFIVEGELTLSSEAPMRVMRSTGETEEIAPLAEVTVGRGDSVQHLDIAAAQTWRNPGASKTVVVGVGVFALDVNSASFTGLFVDFGGISWRMSVDEALSLSTLGLPEGPVTATIRRLTFAPGTALPPDPSIVPTLRWVESGELGWTPVGDGIATRGPDSPLNRYASGLRIPWTKPDPSVQIVLSNPSQRETAVVWEVLLTPLLPSFDTTTESSVAQ